MINIRTKKKEKEKKKHHDHLSCQWMRLDDKRRGRKKGRN